jgi:hypothetical protein
MNITLPPELEALVQKKLATGFYHDAENVIATAP